VMVEPVAAFSGKCASLLMKYILGFWQTWHRDSE
jgi:hypothetical protein